MAMVPMGELPSSIAKTWQLVPQADLSQSPPKALMTSSIKANSRSNTFLVSTPLNVMLYLDCELVCAVGVPPGSNRRPSFPIPQLSTAPFPALTHAPATLWTTLTVSLEDRISTTSRVGVCFLPVSPPFKHRHVDEVLEQCWAVKGPTRPRCVLLHFGDTLLLI